MNTLHKLRDYLTANPDAKPEVAVAWWIKTDNEDKEPADMVDYAMCRADCPRHHNCRRHVDCGYFKPAGDMQTYLLPKEFPCPAYWMAPHEFLKKKGQIHEKE